jgi:L-fuculose-phosphate aldolase
MNERELRREIVDVARRLHARGWVANHDGNVTARAGAGRILATPTATSKAAVDDASLLVVDDAGEKLSGPGKAFSELGLHVTVYARRPDARAVVHAHPPCATALACAGARHLERPFMAEAVVSIGPGVPTVPFAPPGREACAALAPFLAAHDAVLLASHGVLAWGDSLEQAYLRLELVEHLARIALEAERVGGVKQLPESALPALLEARRKAGLGPEARGGAAASAPAPATATAAPRRVVACAPAPGTDVEVIAPGRSTPSTTTATVLPAPAGELAAIIREELARALREK